MDNIPDYTPPPPPPVQSIFDTAMSALQEPMMNQLPPSKTGHKSQATIEREAMQEAVERKKEEIKSTVETKPAETRGPKGEFPIEASQFGVRDAGRKDVLYPIEVAGCLNGFPAVGMAAYFSPPEELPES